MQGILNIRCSSCLRREIRIDDGGSHGSPPQNVRSIAIGNLEQLCGELARNCTFETLRKMKEHAQKSGNKKELVSKLEHMLQAERVDEEEICSDWIRFYILVGEWHPAKAHLGLFSKDHPHIAVTYQWTLGLGKKRGLLSKLKGLHRGLLIFLDVLFIDQLSNNVVMNLAKAQEIYGLLLFHVAITKGRDKLLDRGWCVFELCLRARAGLDTVVIGDAEELGFQGLHYDYYGNMKLSFEADKKQIDYAFRRTFGYAPGSFARADGKIINSVLAKQVESSSSKQCCWAQTLPTIWLPPATLAPMLTQPKLKDQLRITPPMQDSSSSSSPCLLQ